MSSFLRVSARCHDGLVFLGELACAWGEERAISIDEVAERSISSAGYLEQIATPLRNAGMIRGERGREGGYRLAMHPKEITVKAVIEALEGPVALVDCLNSARGCPTDNRCRSKGVWSRIQKEIKNSLNSLTLADIIK